MSRLEDLSFLDLRSLSDTLAAHAPAVSELRRSEWLGVVELITLRLTVEHGSLPAESWATSLSAYTYALEAAVTSGSIDQRECLIRRLHLASLLLRQIPPNVGTDILDPGRLIDLTLQEIPMSAEEARDLSAEWRALDISQIRILRKIKNLLSPALGLVREADGEVRDERLKAWEEVVPSLP
ncbi:hypothetical protein ACIO1C_17525 [Streptomyces sp. NPDC087420]|uniref:hypothetical protein n=1 Tax=Streptomyces sp. NPDC087420 TaxID=3365785 RepID=UPI00383268AC